MSVPVITIVVLSVMLAGQPFIPDLEEGRQKVKPICASPKNLFKWLYLMGLIEGLEVLGNCGID
jgi:hypothetical protein